MPYSLEIHHLDVGQGDATLILIKKNGKIEKSILIDCGPSGATGRVTEYVSGQIGKDNSLDIFIISHLHNDHKGNYTLIHKKLNPGKECSNFKKQSNRTGPISIFGDVPEVGDEILGLGDDGPHMTCVKNDAHFNSNIIDEINDKGGWFNTVKASKIVMETIDIIGVKGLFINYSSQREALNDFFK